LKEHGVYLHYTQDDLEHDRQAGDAFPQEPLVGLIVIADATPLSSWCSCRRPASLWIPH
jgi:hypothetical protein